MAAPFVIAALVDAVAACSRTPPARPPAGGESVLYFGASLSPDQSDAAAGALASLETTQVNLAHLATLALHMGASVWLASHDSCPTVAEILTAYRVEGASDDRDAWDTPYVITCLGGDAEVRSAGPDGRFGTADDVVARGP